MAERLAPYELSRSAVTDLDPAADELVQKAATLLLVMPINTRRETIEELVSPHDRDRGRRAVDALIERAFAAEDHLGRLHRVS